MPHPVGAIYTQYASRLSIPALRSDSPLGTVIRKWFAPASEHSDETEADTDTAESSTDEGEEAEGADENEDSENGDERGESGPRGHPSRRDRDGVELNRCEWHSQGERCTNEVTHEVGQDDERPNLYVCEDHADEVEISETEVPVRPFTADDDNADGDN